MVYQKGGQVKEVVSVVKSAVKTSGDIVKDLADGLVDVIGGFTNGLEVVVNAVGDTLNNVSDKVSIRSVHTIKKVGDFAGDITSKLGNVVKVVPILGHPMAYVVKGSGKGVYYVITTVGHVVGKGVKSVGSVGKGATDLVVFTISTASDVTEKVISEAGETVKNVAHSVVNGKKEGGKSNLKTKKRKN
jgi:hypothetical protein